MPTGTPSRKGGPRVIQHGPRSSVTRVEVGGVRVVLKQWQRRGPWRLAADRLRGSPAARAWRGGVGLRARRIGAAVPYAFLERRRLGLPVASWLLLEDLWPALPADVGRRRAGRAAGRGRARGATRAPAPRRDPAWRSQGEPRLPRGGGFRARGPADRSRGRALRAPPPGSRADPGAGAAQRLAPRRVPRRAALSRLRTLPGLAPVPGAAAGLLAPDRRRQPRARAPLERPRLRDRARPPSA